MACPHWALRGLPVLPCWLDLILSLAGISAVSYCGAGLWSRMGAYSLNQHPSCVRSGGSAWSPCSWVCMGDLPWFKPFLSLIPSRKCFSTPRRSAGARSARQPWPSAALGAWQHRALRSRLPPWPPTSLPGRCPALQSSLPASPPSQRGARAARGDPSIARSVSRAVGTPSTIANVLRPASSVLSLQKANNGCWALAEKSPFPSVCWMLVSNSMVFI